jgi:small-conductance mechanosensitive channel
MTDAAQPPLPSDVVAYWHELDHWVSDNSGEILLAVGAAAAIAGLLYILRSVGHRLIRDRGDTVEWRDIFGKALSKTGTFFILATAAKLVSTQASAPPTLQRLIDILFTVAAAFQAAIWARELVLGLIERRVGEDDAHKTLKSAIGIIRLLITFALFAVAIIVILDNLGVNVTGLIAGLGIGGIAIGLAAKGIFDDLFAALSIIFDKPFRPGDTITFGTMTGTVEQIGLKTTRIRALNGEQVVMSNANLLNEQVQNWAKLQRRRCVMTFGVIYQTVPETLARIPLEVKEIVEAQPLATFDRCHATLFAASSIDFELVFNVESPDMADFMATRQAIMLGMIRIFAELGIDFAYPTQTNFTAAPDGSMVMPYPQAPVPKPRKA